VAVMYMGRIVERAAAEELYRNPLHPYTRALISAIPQVAWLRRAPPRREPGREMRLTAKNAESAEKKIKLKNSALSASSAVKDSPPTGCAFGPRCPLATGDCLKQTPMLKERSDYKGHFAACWKC